nr:heat shock protein 90 [Chrysogorgia stellata]
MNRKRLRVDEESFRSVSGRRTSCMSQSKSKKHNELFSQDNSSQVNTETTPPAERPLLPLSDITYQTQDLDSSRMARLSGAETRRPRRERSPRNVSSSSSPPNPDTGEETSREIDTSRELNKSDKVTVTYVNNLFSPVNKLQAIPLTLDELQRRTEYPESFGRSELVSYLRHSKTTGNDILTKYDLKPNSGRSRLNVLSRLCEREAKTLADGIHNMNTEYFPMAYVVDTTREELDNEKRESVCDEKSEINDTKETISNTMDFLDNLKKLLKNPDKDLAEDLEIFEKATHTFGCQNILNHISFVEHYLEELQKKL